MRTSPSRLPLPILARLRARVVHFPRALLAVCGLLVGVTGITNAAATASATVVAGATWYVTSTGTATGCASPAGTSSDPFGTIAGALACATDGDKVLVGAGQFSGGFSVASNVTIEGAGAFSTTITGLASTLSPAPTSEVTLAPGVEATLDGLTVTGASQGGSTATNAVSMTSGSLVLDKALLEDEASSPAQAVVSASPPSGTAASVTLQASTVATGAFSTDAGVVVAYNGPAGSTGLDRSTVSIVNSTIDASSIVTATVTVLNTNLSLLDDTVVASALQALRALDASTVSMGGTVLLSQGNKAATCSATLTDLGNNLVVGTAANSGCTVTNGVDGDIVSTSGLDPHLGPLADNGGPTPTMALLAGSPAIGTNSVSNCTSSVLVNDLDQRGDPRNAAARAACDIGAYDTGGTSTTPAPAVTSLNPTSGSSAGHRYLEIFGSNLSPAGETCLWYKGSGCQGITVDVGGNAAFVIYGSPSELLVLTPAGSPGTAPVSVTVAGQTSTVTSGSTYTYI